MKDAESRIGIGGEDNTKTCLNGVEKSNQTYISFIKRKNARYLINGR